MWFRIDDSAADHPKFDRAGDKATGVWMRCAAYSAKHLTDGFIPDAAARRYAQRPDIKALLDAGLWERVDGGYAMHDWHDYQPSKEDVERQRERWKQKRRERRNHTDNPGGRPPGTPPETHTETQRETPWESLGGRPPERPGTGSSYYLNTPYQDTPGASPRVSPRDKITPTATPPQVNEVMRGRPGFNEERNKRGSQLAKKALNEALSRRRDAETEPENRPEADPPTERRRDTA